MSVRRRRLTHRVTSLLLSWVFTATTFWSMAPPEAQAAPGPRGPRPALIAGFPESLSGGEAADSEAAWADPDPSPAMPLTADTPVTAAVRPILECVVQNGPNQFTAYFGYKNENAVAVTILVGANNKFTPLSQGRGQPTIFQPGRTPYYPNAAFSVPFDGNNLVWTLKGPDGSGRTSTASRNSKRCQAPVDVTPPTLTVVLPVPGSYLGVPADRVRLEYGDGAGSGIVPESVELTIDGQAPLRDGWTVTTTVTEGPLVPPLGDGVHALVAKVRDAAGNTTTLPAGFTVDTQPPVLTLEAPADGSYHKASPVTLTGTVVDADPQVSVRCLREGAEAPATVSGASLTCSLPLAEGANAVRAEGRDRLAHTGTSEPRTLQLDTTPPRVWIDDPQDQSWAKGETVTVSGHLEDASPILEVTVGGVAATLTGSTFAASGVPVGTGAIVAKATDAAGNAGETTVQLRVDRQSPAVGITSPAEGSWVRGPQVEVSGSVDDAEGSPVVVEVNGRMEADPLPIVPRGFRALVDAGEGPVDLVATARDAAGNASVTPPTRVNVDFTQPVIALSQPAGEPITSAASVRVAGTVTDISPTTLMIDGANVDVAPDGSFSTDVPLAGEGEREIALVATDSVGLVGRLDLRVIVDRTRPEVQIISPAEGVFLLALPVVVEGTVTDGPAGLPVPPSTVTVDGQAASVTGQVWTITFDTLPNGPHTFTAQARDAAGNVSLPVQRNVVLDLLPPTVTITDPAAPLLTRLEAIQVRGTAAGRAPISVTVGGVAATVTGAMWEALVPLVEGDNTITAIAKSASGRESAPASVMVTRDGVAPTVDLQTPESIGRGEPGKGRVDAADNMPGVVVEVRIDGVPVGPPAAPPYEFDIVAPPQAQSGATLEVTAVATDKAGNVSSPLSRTVRIASAGVVVGQVLSDETGLPLPEATVVLETPSGPKTALSDEHGAYSFPTGGSVARLQAAKAGMIAVEREVVVESGVGTVVLDSRLTTLGESVLVGTDGLVLPKVDLPGPIPIDLVLNVPLGAVSQPTPFRLTPLSAQGLPALLPLGWSPIVAFDVRADSPVGPGLEATLKGLPDGTLHLARFDTGRRAWTMAQAGLVPVSGALTVVLGGTGAFALVVPDADPAPAVPAPGEVLPGVVQADLPPTAVGQAAVEPSVLPPSGGKATGRLFVQSPTPLPSGTVVQAKVTEEFELASGKKASEEVRRQDILLFRAPLPADAPAAATGETVLHAALPVAPSRTFEAADLLQGKVHLDVLAGRESVRGRTGGNRGLTLQSGGAILSVPASSLPEDTVVDIDETALSSFLPAASDLEPLSEVVLDFAGAVLGTSAGLSVAGEAQAGDTLLVARVERVLGIPRLLVVALGEANGGRIAALPVSGLPGIKEGGRYVFYRLSQWVGWVSGATTLAATGAAVGGAVVESDGLPFIGRSRLDTPYLLVARAATAQVSATMPGTRLVASGSATVLAGGPAEAVWLPLVFSGAVTTATVTPADAAQGVAVSVQVEVEATAALDPSPTNLARAKLFKGPEPVEVKLFLSGSGKRVAVVPAKPLAVSTVYTFTVAGLKDAANADVVVASPVSFTTKDFVPPVVNTNAIVFSYPENGITKVTAPPGSLPPFSEVLILNSTNGAVLWLQVDGEGCIGCLGGSNELPATIDDRLLVTITDPQGNVTTFERSKFVGVDGTVAIGRGGGTVEGAGGVELRIPSGALEKGVELKVEGLSAETLLQQFPGQVPDLGRDVDDKPLAKLAGGIKIASKDAPSFTKPVDLAFPVPDFTKVPEAERPPAGKPEDAYYYVVRRLEGPCADGSDTCAAADRRVLFQTIDHAFPECPEGKTTCEASEKKVVTASWPFSGYVDSFGGFGFSSASLLIQPVAVSYAYLLWTYDQALPGQALAGVVTGKVLRTKWNPGATTPQYEGVKGALVSAVDASGQRLLAGSEQAAITREDGSFTLWDPRYVGGTVRVAATLPGVGGDVTTLCPPGDGGDASVRCGTAYEADPADWKTSGLRFHRNIATVNLTFPAVQPPPPPPAIGVVVYRVVDGKREDTRGIVPAGTPLILGVKPSSPAVEVREVQVQGGAQSFRSDPLKGQPTGADWIVEYTPGTVGTYRVEVTGLGASAEGTAEAVKGGTTFRVIGAGGTDEIVEGARPEVIPARTVPKSGASGVQISTYVQVVFTEPVRKVSGNVFLKDAKGQPIAVRLSGVLRHGGVVEDLAASPDAVITSLTVQPLSGLEYGATYRLELGDGIEDLDTTPRGLVPYDTQFTTFTPESLSTNPESFGSPGIVVLGERAYLVQNHFHSGTLRVFETADPVSPLEIPNSEADSRDPRYYVSYRPVDLVGESDSPLTGGRVVAVVTGPTAQSKPSNLWLLDVNDDAKTQWVGAVSLTSSAQDGFVSRTFLRAGVLYAATFRKGIQVVDLGKVKDAFKPVETDATGHFQMRQAFLTDGQGYGQENVISIPVSSPFGGPARLNDIEAALTQTADGAQVLVAAPGDPGLTVVNPATQSVLWNDKVTVERDEGGQKVVEATLRYGQAIGLGNVAGQDLAVVVGSGTVQQETQSRPLLMVVSLYDPSHPVGLGYVQLEDATVGDVILKDDMALLGGNQQVTLVSLTDKTRPKVLGTAAGVGGRLALGENGSILFSTERSVFGGTDLPLGGVRTAALGKLMIIESVAPMVVITDLNGRAAESFEAKYRLIPEDADVVEGTVEVVLNGQTRSSTVVPLTGGRGSSSFPIGTPIGLEEPGQLRISVRDASGSELVSALKRIPVGLFRLGPEGPIAVSVDEETMDLLGYAPGVIEAVAAGKVTSRTVQWSLVGGESLSRTQSAGAEGVFVNTLKLPTQAGATAVVKVNLPGSGPIAETAPIVVEPGVAAALELSADRVTVPADRASTVTLRLIAKDRFGNPVKDGTSVVWSLDGDGALASEESVTSGGEATKVYQVGAGTGPQKITAKIDDAQTPVEITAAPVEVEVQVDPPALQPGQAATVRVRATSDAGTPADGAPIVWLATWGRLSGSVPSLVSGEAVATFTAGSNAGVAYLLAVVGQTTGQARVPVVPLGFHAQLDPPYFTGNQVGDGAILWEGADGEVTSCPYSGSTLVRIRGGEPGATVTAALSAPDRPNLEPIAWYTMNELLGSVPDIYHDHPGESSGGVTLDTDLFHAGGASYRFDGTGVITVPDHPAFALESGLQVSAAVYLPDTVASEGEIVAKDGVFALRLTDGRPAFGVSVAGAWEEIVFPTELAPGAWHTLGGSYSSGLLRIMVGEEVEERALAGGLDTGTAPIVVGRLLSGSLDDVKVYDLSRPRLIAFAGGADEIEITLDAAGEATVPLFSLGNLRTGSPQVDSATIRFRLRPGDPTRPPQQTEVDECIVRDGISCDVARFMDGVITGTAENKQEATGSFVGSFVPFWGDPRDLVLSLIDIARGRGSRALNGVAAIFSVLGILSTVGGPLDALPTTLKIGSRNLAKAGLEEKAVAVFLQRSLEAAKGGAKWEESKILFEWLTSFSKAKRLAEISPVLVSARRLDDLLSLVRHFDNADRAVELLIRIKASHGLDVMEGVLEIAGKKGLKWSEEGFEGIGVWLAKSAKGESAVVDKALDVFGKTGAKATGEKLFKWVRQAEGLPGTDDAIRIANNFGDAGVQGLYHQFDEVMTIGISDFARLEEKLSAVVNGKLMESAVDATRKGGQRLEMKSLSTYTSGAAHKTLEQLGRNLEILQARGELAASNLTYVFRGKFDQAFRDKMLKKAREVLAPGVNRTLFTEKNIIFRGKDVPF